jgi:hypothetical protein
MSFLDQLLKSMKTLQGHQDSRGPKGILSRGANVYNAGSLAAHSGGGIQYGRPPKEAIKRRLFR